MMIHEKTGKIGLVGGQSKGGLPKRVAGTAPNTVLKKPPAGGGKKNGNKVSGWKDGPKGGLDHLNITHIYRQSLFKDALLDGLSW